MNMMMNMNPVFGRAFYRDPFFRPFFDMSENGMCPRMHADVHEDEDKYVIGIELPGVPENAIDISVDNDVLSIKADMNARFGEHCGNEEKHEMKLERSWSLEGIDQDNITAESKLGMLYVTLPKIKPAVPAGARHIPVLCGSQQEQKILEA